MSSRGLPARPDLAQYKKQAKELVKSYIEAAPEAVARIGKHHPRFPGLTGTADPFKLADAQLTIAREHDFETWAQFAAHIRTLRPDSDAPAASDPAAPLIERISASGVDLEAHISGTENSRGIVLFPLASGSQRYHPSYRYLAQKLNGSAICTVVADLLTEDEELADLDTGDLAIDIRLLGARATALTDWIAQDARFRQLPLGCFASGTGAAAAMLAAGDRPSSIRAVVSGGGRPDLAGPWLRSVTSPTLFIVGSRDTVALGFTQSLVAPMPQNADRKLAVLEGAHRIFDEPDALRNTAALALHWFRQYLAL